MTARRALLGLVLFVALAAAAWGFVRHDKGAGTLRAQRRDVVLRVDVEGELVAASTERLGPPSLPSMWNFKLSFLASEGKRVEAGETVLGFDSTDLRQQLMGKTAERDRAEKELEKRLLDIEKERRAKTLQGAEADARLRQAELKLSVPVDIEAQAVLRQARIDRDLAQLEVRSLDAGLRHLDRSTAAELGTLRRNHHRAAARVEEIEVQIAALEVKAPRAGTVIYHTTRGQEKPKIGDTVWWASKLIELPDLESLRGDGFVAEADAGKVATLQPVSLRFDAFPDTIVHGRVSSVRRTVQTKPRSSGEKIMRLEIVLENPGAVHLRPGMRFRGEIEVERFVNALVVPHEAIVYGRQGAELRVRTGLGTEAVRPEFGAADDDGVVVLGGLDDDARLEARDPGARRP